MKLPIPALSNQEQLEEFDIWITPSLGEIRDTERFKEELARIAAVFEVLSAATNSFALIEDCRPAAIAATYATIAGKHSDAEQRFHDLASTLFLVTGKSDNNAKCQLPIYLRDVSRLTTLPRVSGGRVAEATIPRVLKSEQYMATVAALVVRPAAQIKLLEAFVGFILSDEAYTAQLWSIGRSFVAMKTLNREKDLISPLVAFQVRGSVAASGGHIPEDKLRENMLDWGLVPGTDFNKVDAVVAGDLKAVEEEDKTELAKIRQKTRAYDFVLPFRVPSWTPRLLVQSQFYAGDSGSVSHKNVDQTSGSRLSAQSILKNARFIEYVDGAGYFSSLNGDLKTLLAMPSTRTFIQLRSAPIPLRREFQDIGFLSPLDVAHSILAGTPTVAATTKRLVGDGYSETEVARGIKQALQVGMLVQSGQNLNILQARRDVVRRYLLLDLTAAQGKKLDPRNNGLKGHLLVPGYGPFHGLPLDELAKKAVVTAPALKVDWQLPEVILGDIRWLCERGFAMTG